MFQYSQNIFFLNILETEILWGRNDPSVTISRLQKKQGVVRSWLRRASAAHLCITLSCKTDVQDDP